MVLETRGAGGGGRKRQHDTKMHEFPVLRCTLEVPEPVSGEHADEPGANHGGVND